MLRRGVLFHRDNAPVHKSVVAMASIHECGFELVQHPPYSPDLAPSDFHMFQNMERHLAEIHYNTNNDVISVFDDFLDLQDKNFYEYVIKALEQRWKKVCGLTWGMLKNA